MDASSAANSYVLVIDLGSTSLKASIVDIKGHIQATHTEVIETVLLPNDGAEQDAEAWWVKARRASKKAMDDAGVQKERILAICCDSQFSVTVPVGRDGKALMNAVHWLDSRGAGYTQKMMNGFPKVQGLSVRKALKWIRHTGLAPIESGVDGLAHMLLIKYDYPEVYNQTYKFLEPVDFLTSRLTGQYTASQHTAVMSVLSSNRKWGSGEYCETLVREAAIDRDKLPNLVANDGICGTIKKEIASELGVSPETKVMNGMLDNQSALIGSGIVDIGQGMIYLGTSLNINAHIARKKTDVLNSITSIPGCLPGLYMLLCEQGLGGKCLDYFLRNVLFHQDNLSDHPLPAECYDKVNEIVATIKPGSGDLLFLPWLNGTLAPRENRWARGGFFNLSLDTTREHMLRAIMEGVAFNSKAALKPVEAFLGRKLDRIRLAGGGALSDTWAQVYADVLERPVLQLDEPHKVTCRGTGLVGFTRLGLLKVEEIPSLVKIRKTFEPISGNIPVYRKLYKQYVRIFKKNFRVFRALNS